jgi:uncharacterized protein YggE
MRNKSILWIVVAFIAVALLVFATSARAQTDAPITNQEPRTLSINGSGTISIQPDIASIQIGVHTEGPNAQETVASNNQQSQQLISALGEAGIANKDIQTSNFSISPRQEWDANGQPTGVITYVVDNSVSVTVRDLTKIGSVLDAAVGAGANNIYGIQFDHEDREAAQQQAITVAMENARARAEVLAEAAGVELGQVMSLQTYLGSANPVPYERNYAMAADMAAASVPVATGEMQIMVDVSVVYEIK